jgi:hypothetical protein
MAKYKVGQVLKDVDDEDILKIIAVAPDLDSDNEQTYFVEVIEKNKYDNMKEVKYYVAYDEDFLDRWTKVVD